MPIDSGSGWVAGDAAGLGAGGSESESPPEEQTLMDIAEITFVGADGGCRRSALHAVPVRATLKRAATSARICVASIAALAAILACDFRLIINR